MLLACPKGAYLLQRGRRGRLRRVRECRRDALAPHLECFSKLLLRRRSGLRRCGRLLLKGSGPGECITESEALSTRSLLAPFIGDRPPAPNAFAGVVVTG